MQVLEELAGGLGKTALDLQSADCLRQGLTTVPCICLQHCVASLNGMDAEESKASMVAGHKPREQVQIMHLFVVKPVTCAAQKPAMLSRILSISLLLSGGGALYRDSMRVCMSSRSFTSMPTSSCTHR